MVTLRTLSLFNTLSRRVEVVRPFEPGVVRVYSCGPTVYNFAHIGNFRTFLFADLLRRAFGTLGYRVLLCMNITDIEDKIILSSQRELPDSASNDQRLAAMRQLTEEYTAYFLQDSKTVGIEPPSFMPHATAYIGQMIRLIEMLIQKGLAYEREGSVYYRIAAFPGYGRLARLDQEAVEAGARGVDLDEYEKDQAQDFALWKVTKAGEPYWESPWGKGRPGWHIECSAMGIDKLGEHIDVHCGGVDLIFPHHTNEIAQSEGCLGHSWVNLWCHGEFLLVEGQKMAKSAGNFFTLRELLERGVDPLVFRYAILSNHYRKVLNFSFEGLRAAEAALLRLRVFRKRMESAGGTRDGVNSDFKLRLEQAREGFWGAICDDLNTPEALAALFTLVGELNAQDDRAPLSQPERLLVLELLDEINSLFCAWPHQEDTLDPESAALIAERQAARLAKQWAESDRIRELLKTRGISVEDRKDGSVSWRRL